jgi:lipopolysaccharide export system protein LptA
MKASGNVSIKIDNTEIKSNKMDIQVHPDKLELSDGKFKATIEK